MSPMKKSTSAPLLYPLSPSSLRTATAGEPAAAGAAEPGPGPGPTAAAGGCLVSANCNFIGSKFLPETMRRRASATLLILFLSLFLFSSFSLYSVRNPITAARAIFSSRPPDSPDHHHHHPPVTLDSSFPSNHIVQEPESEPEPEPDLPLHNLTRQYVSPALHQDSPSSLSPPLLPPAAHDGPHSIESVSVLMPDWEVLVIVSPQTSSTSLVSADDVICLYPNGATSPVAFYRILPSTNQSAFKCYLPPGNRRRLPFLSPVLVRSSQKDQSPPPPQEMMRWNFMVYDSFSTEDDVVLFVKGVNNRQGINRSPKEFRCVFTDDKNNTVRTAVTSSIQEVFRCPHPDLTALNPGGKQGGGEDPIKVIKISLEIWDGKEEEEKQALVLVPSLAYYTPWHKIANAEPKLKLCACTMVYNVAKFLREWVVYHSSIGVQKFILYDNESDDDLKSTVDRLNREGYKVETVMWVWPKTQEAGFSHAALYAKHSCTWMMYVDVDEFVFSPSWEQNSGGPSDHMLKSFLPNSSSSSSDHHHHHHRMIGQVSIKCNEFGPSNQKTQPVEGVTQGYDCRRKQDNRHKSIVLLDAVDHSLLNVIHHFHVKDKYRWKQISLDEAVVNHYKYQAWSEFKAKFRRRVSAYVVDWRNSLNPKSKDRTPGLGFQAIKPPGWENKFCEVRDARLKLLTQRWFGKQTQTGYKMAWQT